jgi:hypothetical protein
MPHGTAHFTHFAHRSTTQNPQEISSRQKLLYWPRFEPAASLSKVRSVTTITTHRYVFQVRRYCKIKSMILQALKKLLPCINMKHKQGCRERIRVQAKQFFCLPSRGGPTKNLYSLPYGSDLGLI